MKRVQSINNIFLFTILLSLSLFSREKFDAVVAVVGDSIILNSELEAYTFLKINQLGLKPDSLEIQILRNNYLNEIIEGKVLLVHAEKDTNISITSNVVERELEMRINMIMQQNKLTLEQFEEAIQREQGISLAKFKKGIRKQIRQELLKQQVQQFYISSSELTKNEVENFYNEYKDSLPSMGESILLSKLSVNISPSKELLEKAYAKINLLMKKINDGESFEEVAKLHSEGPNAANGGDLGFITKGTLQELTFEEKIFSLKPGNISEPFRTRLGFHIIEILFRKDLASHVRQLFVSTQPSKDSIDVITMLLDSVRLNVSTPDQFIKAVDAYCTESYLISRKGKLPWQSKLQVKTAILDGFDTFAVGQVSKPIKLEKEIAIFRIDEITSDRHLTLTDDYNNIADIAKRIYSQKKLFNLVKRWQQEIYIDIRM